MVLGAHGRPEMRHWKDGLGVTMTTNRADYEAQPPDRGSVSVEELARRQGVRPIESVESMARDGIFDSDEELDEFIAHVYASRRADLV